MIEKDLNAVGNYLRAIDDEEIANGESESVAEAIARGREAKEKQRATAADLIQRQLGGYAPQGHSNGWKVEAIADFLTKKGAETPELIQAKLRGMLVDARARVKTRGLSDLDRVFLLVKGGQVR